MPLGLFKHFVFPSQDLAFSTERCRTILKIPPQDRKASDVAYLLNNVLKSHAFFQQMTLTARTKLATNMSIGFIDEGEVLVDIGEVLTAGYILLSGSAKICFESTGGGGWTSTGSPTTSPVLSRGRLINGKMASKLEPGDIFGIELMIQKKASGVLLKVTEPSEFIVVKDEAYRDALGVRDGLAGKVKESEFKGLTIHYVMEQRVHHPGEPTAQNAKLQRRAKRDSDHSKASETRLVLFIPSLQSRSFETQQGSIS